MKRTASILSLCGILLGPAAMRASADHYKLFILTGQSNSLGTTNGGETDLSPGSDPADPRIKFWWHNVAGATTSIGDSGGLFKTLQAQQGGYYAGSATHWGPEINFGRTLYRAGVRNFGIIKASRGGGGNSFWLKAATDHHMYTHVVNTVNAATATLTANGDTFEIIGLLYLQGESDSATEAAAAGANFKTLVDNLRVDLPNASNLFGMVGGIAASGSTRDTVRANQTAIGSSTSYIDAFSNLDLQSWTAADALHFNKAAKLRIGERYAQAFFSAGTVARQYGKLVFIGDSITQGGNGDYPGYRYTVFKQLANKGVPIDATTGYKFTGSVTGPYSNSTITTPAINGQTFENVHDGHWGWRASWENARVALPVGRYNTNNLGSGTILNWSRQSTTYVTADVGTLSYSGITYVPDTVSIMIGINDLGDNVAETQVRDDIGTMIDQLRAANPSVRIFLNNVLHTNQGATRDTQVNTLNALLPALVTAKNTANTNSPVWLMDADTDFTPATMTYDNVHPNATGEAHVGDRIAAALGIIETPMASVSVAAPPHLESGSSAFSSKFEGNEIWNGTAFVNSWNQLGTLTKTLPDPSDLKIVNPSIAGNILDGSATGWNTANNGNWTFEIRLKFTSNANGFILWCCTDTQRILVEVNGTNTEDYDNLETETNSFHVDHNNLDGQFHTFRIAHDAGGAKYHVWRDGVRLTPVAGAAYDQAGADSRLLMGDYTNGVFGNYFDATIDYVRYDQTGAYLPTGADADADGLPDSWEHKFYGDVISGVAGADDDGDGKTNLEEYAANTDPKSATSVLKVDSITLPAAGKVQVRLDYTSPQRNYTLQKSINLGMSDPWTGIAGPMIGMDASLTFEDSTASDVRAFYRVLVTIP